MKNVRGDLTRTKFDLIKRGIAIGLKLSKICLADRRQEHGSSCWIASLNGYRSSTELQATGINVFSFDYCIKHR